jgi:hypothetical protein
MLGVVFGTCLVLDAMANSPELQDWIRAVSWRESKWKKLIPLFCTNDHFLDAEDRVLHEQIPSADFSHGGVYFVGASNITWGLKLWDQPATTRALINNLATEGSNHADHFDMIRFLVESEGLLAAGAEKTLIVIVADYHLTHEARVGEKPRDLPRSNWTRRGFYTVHREGVIQRSRLSPVLKALIRERAKITGLLKELVNIAYVPLKRERVHDPRFYNDEWKRIMKPDWQERIRVDLDSFARSIDYLKRRGAKLTVVQMPRGSWEANVPFNQYYDELLVKICDAGGVKIHDFTRLVPDDDFADSVHLTPSGIEKFQAAVMPICIDHLRSTGVLLPNDQPGKQ